MLPFDRRPWAPFFAAAVVVLSLLGAAVYILAVHLHHRSLDWGERAIVFLLLLTIIPPNVLIAQRGKLRS